jgi:hypothetical protein
MLLFSLSLATPARAQMIRGVVFDARSGSPVNAVDVVLLARNDSVVGRYVSDEDGRFSIRLRETGSYVLRASRIGYDPVTTGITLLEPQQEAVAELHLQPRAIPLDPFEASAGSARDGPESRRLERVGFYRRKRMGFGHFLTAADIEAWHLVYPQDLFTGVRGVRVTPGGKVLATSSHRACSLAVAIDGLLIERGGYPGSDTIPSWTHVVNVNDIHAVEVFPRPAGIPVWMGSRFCGAILIWTKGFVR